MHAALRKDASDVDLQFTPILRLPSSDHGTSLSDRGVDFVEGL